MQRDIKSAQRGAIAIVKALVSPQCQPDYRWQLIAILKNESRMCGCGNCPSHQQGVSVSPSHLADILHSGVVLSMRLGTALWHWLSSMMLRPKGFCLFPSALCCLFSKPLHIAKPTSFVAKSAAMWDARGSQAAQVYYMQKTL